MTASDLSRHYSKRIESIPFAPPTPPLPATLEDGFGRVMASDVRMNGHDYDRHHSRFNSSAEATMLDYERDILRDIPLKKNTTDKKRQHASESETYSHGEQMGSYEEVSAPSVKRRKLENGMATPINGADHDLVQEPSILLKLSLSKLKSKAKQQRELSHDSASAVGTPKTRKKYGPKKKTGLALEVDTEHGSRPASLLGDITPSASRPSSPVPLNTSMVYGLDEQIPPLKRAKKVDDATLVKRIKTLEESQKKVWTNIARRDIVKASHLCSISMVAKRCFRSTSIIHLATKVVKDNWNE